MIQFNPAFKAFSRKMPSAKGLRQIFPRQTIKIFMGAKVELKGTRNKEWGRRCRVQGTRGKVVQSVGFLLAPCFLCLVSCALHLAALTACGFLLLWHLIGGQVVFWRYLLPVTFIGIEQ
jgi:hypothetical protein